jgi:lysophospholipase L1-like esterase
MLLLIEGSLRVAWYVAGRTPEGGGDPSVRGVELSEPVAEVIDGTLRYNIVSNVLTTPDRDLLFRVRPNPSGEPVFCYDGIDSNGFRNGRRKRSEHGATVLLVGDSCAFGWGICAFDKTIGSQLERDLKAGGMSSASVFNLAQPGYSSEQSVRLLRRWLPQIRPSYVVLYLGWNDRWKTKGLTDSQALWLTPLLTSPWARIMTATTIYRTLEWMMVGPRPVRVSDAGTRGPTEAHFRVPLARSLANFGAMIELSRRSGASVLIVNHPHAAGFPRTRGIEEFADALEVGFRHDADFVSLPEMSAQSAGARRYFQSDGFHPNAAGARYMARALADAILVRSGPGGSAPP